MPVITRYMGYNIYIWTNENSPLEQLHVHIAHKPRENADKFWITEAMKNYYATIIYYRFYGIVYDVFKWEGMLNWRTNI